ncbi:MAG: polysaccharide export protein [Lysobacterales bacterium]|nr:MAG: polysaccharide export protein [Xanthomonadales bacterium]
MRLVALALLILLTTSGLRAQEEEPPVAVPGASNESVYRLGAGDRVSITVFNQQDLSGEYALDEKGGFSMPLIGAVDAEGLSSSELEQLLVGRFKPDYLVNPRIYVQVLTYRPYYLVGEVGRTGSFPYVAGMSYLKAVAIAGGFTYRAKQDYVFVVRADDPLQQEVRVDVNEKVQPGDIIRVAERMF